MTLTTDLNLKFILATTYADMEIMMILNTTEIPATLKLLKKYLIICMSRGVPYTMTWEPTNYYASGDAAAPEGVKVIGGKTGTTDEAGSCLVLYEQDQQGRPYISIVMGASQKSILYDNMTRLMSSGINGK